MAIDTFITCTIDPSAASKPDGFDHVHNIKRNTANAQDLVIAFDKSKVKTRTVLRSAVKQMLAVLEGGNELTA